MSLLNDAKMPNLKDKIKELAVKAEEKIDRLEKKDEKIKLIIKKSAKKN